MKCHGLGCFDVIVRAMEVVLLLDHPGAMADRIDQRIEIYPQAFHLSSFSE